MKKLYYLTQDKVTGYDTYSDCVVCAESEEEARNIHPSKYYKGQDGWWWFYNSHHIDRWEKETEGETDDWCKIIDVKVREIGIANDDIKVGVICTSYHAG